MKTYVTLEKALEVMTVIDGSYAGLLFGGSEVMEDELRNTVQCLAVDAENGDFNEIVKMEAGEPCQYEVIWLITTLKVLSAGLALGMV